MRGWRIRGWILRLGGWGLIAIEALRSGSKAAESARLRFRGAEDSIESWRLMLPSELGVRMPDRGRDASASSVAEEDMNGEGCLYNVVHVEEIK
jgi:hypothetical protein